MLGKTHLAVGIASSLLIMHPDSVQDMILAVGIGGLGALIPDIDVGTSKSHKDANKIIALSFIIAGLAFVADAIWSFGILSMILNDSNYYTIAVGAVLFIGLCIFGKNQPHRSFMHSILALILMSAAIGLIWIDMVPYFAIGFLSHIITDLFNYKKVRLLYPLKVGVAFKLFHAHGFANSIMFIAGTLLATVQIIGLSIKIICA